ncbi:MAG: helix-turn-helix transcriptional regulator [Thermoplasmata archaeon]|nr:helix-turn-helix transcriptional regulator [Thermoplasmata archaeon]
MPSPRAGRGSASARSPARTPPAEEVPWSEVDHCFQEFREASVRLVERVNDLTRSGGSSSYVPRDVQLVRSVFGKWSAEVLMTLHGAPYMGFEELRRALPGISPRVLSLKLKGLEQRQMVRREVVDARPPQVRYALTEQGWTVAWLADPVLLFLEQSAHRQRAALAPAAVRPPELPSR